MCAYYKQDAAWQTLSGVIISLSGDLEAIFNATPTEYADPVVREVETKYAQVVTADHTRFIRQQVYTCYSALSDHVARSWT